MGVFSIHLYCWLGLASLCDRKGPYREQGIASQPGYAHATETLYHDSVTLCCVVMEKTMCARQTKLGDRQTKSGTHDRAGALRLGMHDRGILLLQTSYSGQEKKKKKDPLGLGCHKHPPKLHSKLGKH